MKTASPKVTVTEADPGEENASGGSPLDASVALEQKTHFRRQFKGTREAILAEAEQIRDLPRLYKTLIAEEIAAADPNEPYLRVDVFRHPHGAGANIGLTVTALK